MRSRRAGQFAAICATLGVVMLLLPRPSGGTVASASSSQTSVSLQQALAAAQRATGQLELERIRAQPQPERIAAALREAMASLTTADVALAAELTAPVRNRQDVMTPARRESLRTQRCLLALRKADLYRMAAAALPRKHAERATYLEQAIRLYTTLRVEYHDAALGLLGYVGEAQARQMAGDVQAAYAALSPVLSLKASGSQGVHQDILRAAKLVDTEILLDAAPERAAQKASLWLRSPEVASSPAWSGRFRWLMARAQAAMLPDVVAPGAATRSATSRPSPASVARLLRDPSVIEVAPRYDRLALLAQLDHAVGGERMMPEERLAWAQLLVTTGHPDALPAYKQAVAAATQPIPADQLIAYATLLRQSHEPVAAADVCDRVLRDLAPGQSDYPAALQLRALALLEAMPEGPTLPPEPVVTRALAALEAVAEAALPSEVRNDALRHWVSLKCRQAGPAACLDLLRANQDVTGDDPYLQYAAASGQWALLSNRLAAGQVDPSLASQQARQILASLQAVQAAAASQPAIAGSCVVLESRILAEAPLADPRAALANLEKHRAILAAADIGTAAVNLQVALLLDLGLVEQAADALESANSSKAADSPAISLRLAEAIAKRCATTEAGRRGTLQQQVLRLCDHATVLAMRQTADYPVVLQRCTSALLQAGAYDNAEQTARRLLALPEVRTDVQSRTRATRLLSKALRALNRPAEALEHVDGLRGGEPDLQIERGCCLLALRQWEQAAAVFRQVRRTTPDGTPQWCEVTLQLAEALEAGGRLVAAEEILRVSQALYPEFGNAHLLAELKRMRKVLGSATKPAA